MAFSYSNDVEEGTHTWTALTTSEGGTAVEMEKGAGLVGCIQSFSGGGTGYNSGTLTIQVSNDNTNWATLKDLFGNDVTHTAAALTDFSTAARFIRPLADGSISDVDIILHLA